MKDAIWYLGFILGVILVAVILHYNGKMAHLTEQLEIIAQQQTEIAAAEAERLDLLRELDRIVKGEAQ